MALALQQNPEPPSELYRIIHRIADRMEPRFRDAYLESVDEGEIDLARMERAFQARDVTAVVAAMPVLSGPFREKVRSVFKRTLLTAASAVSEEFAAELGVTFSFNASDPAAVLEAERNAATLVQRVSAETRMGIRNIVTEMMREGVSVQRGAREIRDLVGLRENHMKAVRNFRGQLRAGDLSALDRRLDAATKERLRSAIRRGEVTDQLIDEASDTYAASLRNRRALDIARTESIRASQAGQHQAMRQAMDRGLVDKKKMRRHWVVTFDDRLRPSHEAIPGMNDSGVGPEEPFDTPFGPLMHPPAGINCRCTVSYSFNREKEPTL